jgi:hypothetical protein
MIRRNQKCRDNADGLPGGVTVESFIDTHAGGCLIGPGEEASHVVTLANRTLLRFEVTVEAECDTDRLRYDNASKVWTQKVEVGHRPLSGGPRRRTLKGNLTCDDQASDEGIKMTIRYESIGCHCVGTATMQLLVDSAC